MTKTRARPINIISIIGFAKKCILLNVVRESTIGAATQCKAQIRELDRAMMSNVLFLVFIFWFLVYTFYFYGS